jgi:SAM-dependent methyltransferase
VTTELARSFERAADAYERGRPGYAEAALDAVGLPADAVVLDLAAGTGKLTRQLVRRFARVIAVEPLAGMRAILERVVPEAEAIEGRADSIPLPDDSVDAVFVAEAFHWFATAETLHEVARVLRPGGMFAILFNQSGGPTEPPLPPAFHEAIDELAIKKPPEYTVAAASGASPSQARSSPSPRRAFRIRSNGIAPGCSRTSRRGAWSLGCPTPRERRCSAGSRSRSRKGATAIRCGRSSPGRGLRERRLKPFEAELE